MSLMTDSELENLARLAKMASERSYSPYSKFPVGAVLVTTDGSVFEGTNVENASYGLTICAERAAIFHAVSTIGGDFRIAQMAIYCAAAPDVGPCGACRQVIREFSDVHTVVYFGGRGYTVDMLMPWSFGPEDLSTEPAWWSEPGVDGG